MNIIEINPFIRFASEMHYISPGKYTYVKDCRMFYTISGNSEIYIDNKKYKLQENSLFYCCSGSRYKIISHDEFHVIALNFDLSLNYSSNTVVLPPEEEKPDDSAIFHNHIQDSRFLNSHLFIENGIKYKPVFEDILYEFSTQKNYYLETICVLMKGLLTDIHKYIISENTAMSTPIKKVTEYIKNNFTKNITNKELADMVGYHEYYLNKMFVSSTGISMHKYILNLRMHEAQRLILNTNLSLLQISEITGFNNYTHFSNYFKCYFGTPPGKYKSILKSKI